VTSREHQKSFPAMTRNVYPGLVLLAALTASCGHDAELTDRIARLAANNIGQVVDLSAATPFDWDEFSVFGGYYLKSEACKVIGLSAWSCFWLDFPERADAAPSLIAFSNKGELVKTALLPRCQIGFSLRGSVKIERKAAKFMASGNKPGCMPGAHHLIQE
jgi:hypothetical protein